METEKLTGTAGSAEMPVEVRELTLRAGGRELLERADARRDVRTAALSGGQRQRLAIARTLAAQPDIVLYDEPTAGLDEGAAAGVARLIQATHARHPATSIVVTHDYQALAPIADRVLHL